MGGLFPNAWTVAVREFKIRARSRICSSTASSVAPPTLSKNTSTPSGQSARRRATSVKMCAVKRIACITARRWILIMVRSIAEEQGVKMPNFFAYMGYAGVILIPVFVLMTFLFFV